MDSPTNTKGQAMTNQAKFLLPGAEVTITERKRGSDSWREFSKAPRMYVWTSSEFDLAEDLMNRTRRPHTEWKKIIKPLVAAYLPQLNLDHKMTWSQHAGCTCSCSPGFILERQVVHLDDKRSVAYFDVHVTLTGAPKIDPTKPGRLVTV
jgi:hypothetical protein